MAREDIGRNAQHQPKLSEAPGSCPTPSSPGHQGAPSAVAASSVNGQGKPGSDSGELWTHHTNGSVSHVGDLKIVGMWPCGIVRALPSSYHKQALDAGLEFVGLAAPDAAQLKAVADAEAAESRRKAGPVVGHGREAEVWTHGLERQVEAVGELKMSRPWWAGERVVLPTTLHDKAASMGLTYLGPASP